jgi:hypothetical protein
MILHYKKNLMENINYQLNKKKSELNIISNNYNTFLNNTKYMQNK